MRHIFVYIFVKLTMCILFLFSAVFFFSALHAKRFERWKNFLWNWWVDCFIAPSSSDVIFLGVHSESIFPFMELFVFSRKLCFLWYPCLLLIAESISLPSVTRYLRLTVVFMWNSALLERFNCYFSGHFC